MPGQLRMPIRASAYRTDPVPLLKVNMYGAGNLAVVTDFTFAATVTV